MDIEKLDVGSNPPDVVNVIIEIPAHAEAIKYEFDKKSGFIFVDRMLNTAMHYPCNYGFIPKTLSDDGDPADVLVIAKLPIISGAVLECRPIGVLMMEDEAGLDEKILCVPIEKVAPNHAHIQEFSDVPEVTLKQITHFFEHYKDLEEGKWAKTQGIENAAKAKEIIQKSIDAYLQEDEK